MPNNFSLPVTRSRRGPQAAGHQNSQPSQRWLKWSIALNVGLILILIIHNGSHLPKQQPSELVEVNEVSKALDDTLQNTATMLQTVRGHLTNMSQALDATRGLLKQELTRPPPAPPKDKPVVTTPTQPVTVDATPAPSIVTKAQATPIPTAPPVPMRCVNGSKLWLTIGIPTVPRKGVDYLTTTLESLVAELPSDPSDPMWGAIQVLVMNNKPKEHEVFEHLRQRIEAADADDHFAQKAAVYVKMIDNPGTVSDPAPPDLADPDDLHNPDDRPGRHVRRQTCDVVTLIEMAAPLSTYFMFMEDDFSSCMNIIRILQYVLNKVNTVPSLRNWFGVRVSYGMNGIILRNSDLLPFSNYLRAHTIRLPPDLLWLEYFQGKREAKDIVNGRFLAVYKYNLLAHIGTVSSFEVRPDRPKWPGCFDQMNKAWSLHVKERFSVRCRKSDISPCSKHDESSDVEWTKHPIEWPHEKAPPDKGGSGGSGANGAPQDIPKPRAISVKLPTNAA